MLVIRNCPLYKQITPQFKAESRFSNTERFKFELPQKGGLVHKKKLDGKWDADNNFGENKFGIMTFQKFHQNPGYLVAVQEDCQIQVGLTVDNFRSEKSGGYKLNIFEIKDNYELDNILEYDEFCREKKLETDVLFLSKNKNGYLFLLVAQYKVFVSNFALTISSDLELGSVKNSENGICKFPWVEYFEGSIESKSGGWIKMHNFLLNQSFILIVGENETGDSNAIEELFIELSSDNKTQHIGVSVIVLNGLKSLCLLDDSEMESVNTNPAFLAEMNAFYLKVPQGTYMIVPTSYEPLEAAERLDYKLKVYSTIGFKFKKMPAFQPAQNAVQTITLVDQAIFQLDIFIDNTEIMIILESIDTDNGAVQMLDFIAKSEIENDVDFRKTVTIESENYFHKVFEVSKAHSLKIGLASKIDKWLKLNMIIYSTIPNSFSLAANIE